MIGLHCLSAFTTFATSRRHERHRKSGDRRLHCLSAFTTFATDPTSSGTFGSVTWSPLPFGVHHVRDEACHIQAHTLIKGLHCLSAFTTFATSRSHVGEGQNLMGNVSIAFRRSPRSRQRASLHHPASVVLSPLPFGVHHVRDGVVTPGGCSGSVCLHCLSAFTTFATRAVATQLPCRPVRHVSIAFRRSPRSRRRAAERET